MQGKRGNNRLSCLLLTKITKVLHHICTRNMKQGKAIHRLVYRDKEAIMQDLIS
jgi:hypothetical protein